MEPSSSWDVDDICPVDEDKFYQGIAVAVPGLLEGTVQRVGPNVVIGLLGSIVDRLSA
jgi:hypothetical protein